MVVGCLAVLGRQLDLGVPMVVYVLLVRCSRRMRDSDCVSEQGVTRS